MKVNKVNICGHEIEHSIASSGDVVLNFNDVRFATYSVDEKMAVIKKIMLYITSEGLIFEWAGIK